MDNGDVCFSTQGITTITGLLVILTGTITFLFKALLTAKDKGYTEMVASNQARFDAVSEDRASYRKMAAQTTALLERSVNQVRLARGEEPFPILAAVVAEHNSPTSPDQARAASLATMKAAATAASLALGFGPLPDVDDEIESDDEEIVKQDEPHISAPLRRGPAGPRGEQGPQGEQGPPGPPGAAA